mmetsp:Transcript_11362/g.24958  ORF Transcript_11362/g.24958 Transcript_11362/m.24958 type:complete len:314 (-) Transcript_11362:1421-2362(-)
MLDNHILQHVLRLACRIVLSFVVFVPRVVGDRLLSAAVGGAAPLVAAAATASAAAVATARSIGALVSGNDAQCRTALGQSVHHRRVRVAIGTHIRLALCQREQSKVVIIAFGIRRSLVVFAAFHGGSMTLRIVMSQRDHQSQQLIGPIRRTFRQLVRLGSLLALPFHVAFLVILLMIIVIAFVVVIVVVGGRIVIIVVRRFIVIIVRQRRALDPRVNHRGKSDNVRLDPLVPPPRLHGKIPLLVLVGIDIIVQPPLHPDRGPEPPFSHHFAQQHLGHLAAARMVGFAPRVNGGIVRNGGGRQVNVERFAMGLD